MTKYYPTDDFADLIRDDLFICDRSNLSGFSCIRGEYNGQAFKFSLSEMRGYFNISVCFEYEKAMHLVGYGEGDFFNAFDECIREVLYNFALTPDKLPGISEFISKKTRLGC